MEQGEIKILEFDGIKFEIHTKFKDAELDIFRRGQKIIDSCITYDQLDNSMRFVELVKKDFIGVASALTYLVESKRIDIKNCLTELENINVIYEKVTSEIQE